MTLKERVIAAEHFIEDEASYLAHLIAAIGRARAGAGIQLALCIPLTILGLGALEKIFDVWPLEMPMADALRLGGLPLFVLGHLLISTTRPHWTPGDSCYVAGILLLLASAAGSSGVLPLELPEFINCGAGLLLAYSFFELERLIARHGHPPTERSLTVLAPHAGLAAGVAVFLSGLAPYVFKASLHSPSLGFAGARDGTRLSVLAAFLFLLANTTRLLVMFAHKHHMDEFPVEGQILKVLASIMLVTAGSIHPDIGLHHQTRYYLVGEQYADGKNAEGENHGDNHVLAIVVGAALVLAADLAANYVRAPEPPTPRKASTAVTRGRSPTVKGPRAGAKAGSPSAKSKPKASKSPKSKAATPSPKPVRGRSPRKAR